MHNEAAKRDEALAVLQVYRRELIARGRSVAVDIARKHGSVTSTGVLGRMRQDIELCAKMDRVDTRWIGALFRSGPTWQREGYDHSGSHRRPVTVWKLVHPNPQLSKRCTVP